jgi:ADP-heptose:LPS heptosyltransferase
MTAIDFTPRRILILRPRGLGDIVLTSAVIDALRRAYRDVALDFISEEPARALLEADARIERVFLLSPKRGRCGRVQSGTMAECIAWMRRLPADVAFDLFSNPRTALLTAFSGAGVRVGLAKRARQFAYNVRVPRFRGRAEDDHRWSCDVMLDILRYAGVRWEGDASLSVALDEEDRAFAQRAPEELGLAEDAPFAAILPGGSWRSKRWGADSFAQVARKLAAETGAPPVVVWGPPEADDARAIAERSGARLAPSSRIREMAALLGRARILVSTDCLGRHLAIAQGVPTVGVFGPTDPRHWTPRHGMHIALRAPASAGYDMHALDPDPVADAAVSLWYAQERKAGEVLDAPRGGT